MNRTHLACIAFCLITAGSAPARAETTLCTEITSLPAVISQGGIYCLTQDLSTAITAGNAILVSANNVTLDCNGRKIGGLAAGAGTSATGIRAHARRNITIRNCNVRGFLRGLEFSGEGAGHVIEDNLFDFNTAYGIDLRGAGSVVRGNRVLDTGGSTVVAYSHGIDVWYDADIIDNSVSGGYAQVGSNGSAVGIMSSANYGGEISRNRVSGLAKAGTGSERGIWANAGNPVIRDNTVIALAGADAEDFAIGCNSSYAVARDNVIIRFGAPAEPVVNCAADGNTINF